MESKKEFRLVGLIYPEMDGWGLSQVNENERLMVAPQSEANHPRYGIGLCEVNAPRGDPDGLMITKANIQLRTDGGTVEGWKNILFAIQNATEKPILHKEDFSYLGQYGEDDED